MKKPILVFLLCFSSIFYLFSQEMILNGGFELPNRCNEFGRMCSPVAWYSTATGENAYGYDKGRFFAKKGLYYSSFVVEDESKKEYIQTWLACPVQAGKQYRLTFYFRKTDKYDFMPFGLYFSNQFEAIDQRRENQKKTHVKIEASAIEGKIKPKKWYKGSIDFVAPINADFMTIGNFEPYFPKRNAPIPQWRINFQTIRYYLDEVSLQPLEKGEKCSEYQARVNEIVTHHARHLHNKKLVFKEVDNDKPLYRPFLENEKPQPILKDSIPKETLPKAILTKVEPPEKITLPSVFFAFDRFEIDEKYRDELLVALEPLRKKAFTRLEIIGHTDNKGNDAYNQSLSLKRAETIAQIIVTQGFSLRESIKTEGRGAKEPIAENTTEEGRQINRRVEILLY